MSDVTQALTADKPLMAIAGLPGVKDLPLKVRGFFAKALMKEAQGLHDEAKEALDQAVANETR